MEDCGIDFGLENNEKDDVTKEIYHVTAVVGQYATRQLYKVLRRTSEQTGHAWVQEILQGHPIRCYEMFRMEKHIFHMLCTELVEHGLKVTTRTGIEKMVAMFLNMVGHAQDSDFNRYEGEDMVELDDDDHGSVDPYVRLTVASSTEMDLV
ncbi:hypothetical protein V6N13_023080 [Hibiscus sabdariffa]